MLFKRKVIVKKSILLLSLIVLFAQNNYSQTRYEKSFYGGLFYISEYIASEEFDSLRINHNDLQLVDTLFAKTLSFYEGDISETLLCLTFSTIPFNKIKVRLPLINSLIIFPLPTPPQRIFDKRFINLPKNIFFDSPKNSFGDKDKLAHFFGNAFLSYNFGWFNLSKFMGIFVEEVEEGLFVDGGFDNRDLIVNNLGELFGKAISNNQNVMPSDALKIYQLLYIRIIL